MTGTGPWGRVEPLQGDFDVGYREDRTLCYLIDERGCARSEGYHDIWAEEEDRGPPGRITYRGELGAIEREITPIPLRCIEGDTEESTFD